MWPYIVAFLLCTITTVNLGLTAYLFRLSREVLIHASKFRLICKLLAATTAQKPTMDGHDYVDELLDEFETRQNDPATHAAHPVSVSGDSSIPRVGHNVLEKRARLVAIAAGGQAKQYLGSRNYTADEIDALPDEDVLKLYARYEARLGALMTKTLGRAALQLYAAVSSLVLPIPPENQANLVTELSEDPFVGHAVSTATCELYHRFGLYLAPVTAALTTMKHCQFGHVCPPRHTHDVPDSVSSNNNVDRGERTAGADHWPGGRADYEGDSARRGGS